MSRRFVVARKVDDEQFLDYARQMESIGLDPVFDKAPVDLHRTAGAAAQHQQTAAAAPQEFSVPPKTVTVSPTPGGASGSSSADHHAKSSSVGVGEFDFSPSRLFRTMLWKKRGRMMHCSFSRNVVLTVTGARPC